MPNLTDTQSILLACAAQHDDGSLYPLPTTITAPKPAVAKSLAVLIKHDLAEEHETSVADQVARSDGDVRYGVFITAAGKAALGIDDDATSADDAGGGPVIALSPAVAHAPRVTKAALVLGLLQRAEGATLPELVAATGWLPHTTRAALTGLRKKGHEVVKSKRDGVTCYSVASVA